MVLAAIDIGSNAARLLVARVDPNHPTTFETISLDRMGLGLGYDVYETGLISAERELPLLKAIEFFAKRMAELNVSAYRAYATAAMRNARNSAEIIERIADQTGIRIEVISGELEADINFLNHVQQGSGGAGIYIDVGGGSTELTVFSDNRATARQSFNIGAIRVLKRQISSADWKQVENFLNDHLIRSGDLRAYGTGGSISRLFTICNWPPKDLMPLSRLDAMVEELTRVSVEDRIGRYSIEPDRAELIVPALGIFSTLLHMAGIDGIYSHRAGLASGMIRSLAKEFVP